ncbi:MAG: hypothetical protein K0S38_911 [Candidatus Paceibacter sp.]|jgi:hypothetical protein|nr:hypothetical protein [Candidatus Paceibacter sp.]
MKLSLKKYLPYLLSIVMVFGFAISAHHAFAQLTPNYTPLAPIEANGVTIRTTDLTGFLIDLFRITVAFSAALAVVMIIVGGIQYMSTDAWSGKQEGQKRINSALAGLLLVMVSYLILYTINPALVDIAAITRDMRPVGAPTGGTFQDKVIPIGHSGEVGNAQVQTYSFLASNGNRYEVTGMKNEDLNNLSDNDFYSFTLKKDPVEIVADDEATCRRWQANEDPKSIITPCHQLATGKTIYQATDRDGVYRLDYSTQAACDAEVNKNGGTAAGWKCTPITKTYGYTKSVNNSTFSNLTSAACQYERNALSTPGNTAGECVQTKLK